MGRCDLCFEQPVEVLIRSLPIIFQRFNDIIDDSKETWMFLSHSNEYCEQVKRIGNIYR
jgi:hypothetical protein